MTHTDPIVVLHLPISKVNVILEGLSHLPIRQAVTTYEAVKQQAEQEIRRQNDFLSSGQAEAEPQSNVKSPAEPVTADSAPS